MRDPERIKPFLKKLCRCWSQVPDWRFGQLMCNFLGEIAASKNRDPFFIEDDEMEKYLDEYFKEEGAENET